MHSTLHKRTIKTYVCCASRALILATSKEAEENWPELQAAYLTKGLMSSSGLACLLVLLREEKRENKKQKLP